LISIPDVSMTFLSGIARYWVRQGAERPADLFDLRIGQSGV
jgi:hypothetical protein